MFAVIRIRTFYDFLWSFWPITWKTSERVWRDRIADLQGEADTLQISNALIVRELAQANDRHKSDAKLVNEMNQRFHLQTQKLTGAEQGSLTLQAQVRELEQRCSRLCQTVRQVHNDTAPKTVADCKL